MEVQRQGAEQEEERWKEEHPKEEERAARRTDSTIHTVPELLLDPMQVDNMHMETITAWIFVVSVL